MICEMHAGDARVVVRCEIALSPIISFFFLKFSVIPWKESFGDDMNLPTRHGGTFIRNDPLAAVLINLQTHIEFHPWCVTVEATKLRMMLMKAGRGSRGDRKSHADIN